MKFMQSSTLSPWGFSVSGSRNFEEPKKNTPISRKGRVSPFHTLPAGEVQKTQALYPKFIIAMNLKLVTVVWFQSSIYLTNIGSMFEKSSACFGVKTRTK